MDNRFSECPECGEETSGGISVTQMPDTAYPFIQLEIFYCVDCDWMTVDDWKRWEHSPIAERG